MATIRKWYCAGCGDATNTAALFDALFSIARRQTPNCKSCSIRKELHLSFAFGLDAEGKDQVVEDAFVPEPAESWPDTLGRTVTYWPFLVITRRSGRERAVWLPYWHIVKAGNKRISKYGQWAPFMDAHLFADLLSQAKAAGRLRDDFSLASPNLAPAV
jgi:hypothetical protein